MRRWKIVFAKHVEPWLVPPLTPRKKRKLPAYCTFSLRNMNAAGIRRREYVFSIANPPPRKMHQKKLGKDSLRRPAVKVVSTDHLPFWGFKEAKRNGPRPIHQISPMVGPPGHKHRLSLIYTGVFPTAKLLTQSICSKFVATASGKLFGSISAPTARLHGARTPGPLVILRSHPRKQLSQNRIHNARRFIPCSRHPHQRALRPEPFLFPCAGHR